MAESTTMGKRLAVVFIGLVASMGVVSGDGAMFLRRAAPKYADVYQPAQKVYIRWDGSEERLLIQTKYEGPAEEMVWIVPVPSQPTVERADSSVFNELSKRTYDLAIDFTDFAGLKVETFSAGGVSRSSSGPVEWHKRIGDYDVALLRPVGGEDVIQWLNANDFATPEAIHPILEDYIRDGWWMVASRIHPDALSAITSEKLAQGMLHPLEMTFQSLACIFPMRLTSMVAGPVEELIYIEGPAHYEPATLTDAPWDIKLFGGPIRRVKDGRPLSDLERAMEIAEGRTRIAESPRLTKLRRVFQPSEMTDDIVFREIDLAQWLASKDTAPLVPPTTPDDRRPDSQIQADFALQLANSAPMRIGQAATQYGRWRDPNGVAPLISALSPEVLDGMIPPTEDCQAWPSFSARFLSMQGADKWSWPVTKPDWPQHPGCGHLRSCIWALGEIGIEHPIGQAAEGRLLACAQHDNQLIRMEAYLALTKTHSERLGPILVDRFTSVLNTRPFPPLGYPWDFYTAKAELDTMAEWITRLGTPGQREVFAGFLGELIAGIEGSPLYLPYLGHGAPMLGWREWIIWRAASTQDEALVPALESLRSRLAPDRASYEASYVLAAEAACGSVEATANIVQQFLDDEARILDEGQDPATGSFTFLGSTSYTRVSRYSLRTQVLSLREMAYVLFPLPAQACDPMIRSALSEPAVSDWYALYLLAGIRKPQACDKERLMQIWDGRDGNKQLLAVDVLYVWGDEQMLLELYDQTGFAKVKSEIAWALATLKVPGVTSVIERQIRDFWNPEWLARGRTFIFADTSHSGRGPGFRIAAEDLGMEMSRAESALWNYFHPAFGLLDDERLVVVKSLAADRTIHAGMRFDLLGMDFGGTEWGLPLLEQAARDILAVDSSSSTTQRILSMMKAVGNSAFAIELASN